MTGKLQKNEKYMQNLIPCLPRMSHHFFSFNQKSHLQKAQKKTGLLLMLLGIFLFLFIFIFLYFKVFRISGFPELLPVKETVAYVEFPITLDDVLVHKINTALKIDWKENVLPWAKEKAALAFLKENNEKNYPLAPLVLIQIHSIEKAFSFLKNYSNPQKTVNELRIGGIRAFSTPELHFAFLSDVLIIASSKKNLQKFLEHQTSFSSYLSRNQDFSNLRKNLQKSFFLYLKSDEIPATVYHLLGKYLPQSPWLIPAFRTIGITAEPKENFWQGSSYAIFKNENFQANPDHQAQAYQAKLLPLLPADIDWMLAGQNIAAQLKKIDLLIQKNADTPVKNMIDLLVKEYFPSLVFEDAIAPLLNQEFALSVNGKKVLFVTEISHESAQKNIEKVRAAFEEIAGKFTPAKHKIALPDGTAAQDFFPDPSQIESLEEIFQGIKIQGLLLGKKQGIYESIQDQKWFISNDLSVLKKALLLTQEPGRNFRESALYRETLQPLLKNPEFLGVAQLPFGTFSLSKRTFSDHMETNFMVQYP